MMLTRKAAATTFRSGIRPADNEIGKAVAGLANQRQPVTSKQAQVTVAA
jgi:hypothetical protein